LSKEEFEVKYGKEEVVKETVVEEERKKIAHEWGPEVSL